MNGYPLEDANYLVSFDDETPPACDCLITQPISSKPTSIERYFGDEAASLALGSSPSHRTYVMGLEKDEKREQWHLYTSHLRRNEPFEFIGIERSHVLISHVMHCLWRAIANTQGGLSKDNPLREYVRKQAQQESLEATDETITSLWLDEDYWGKWVGTFESAVRSHITRYVVGDGGGHELSSGISQREADDITYLKHQLEIEILIQRHFPQQTDGRAALKLLTSMFSLTSQQMVEVAGLTLWFVESIGRAEHTWLCWAENGGEDLENSLRRLLETATAVYEKKSQQTGKARKKSELVRTEMANDAVYIAAQICNRYLMPHESLLKLFTDSRRIKLRNEIISACFKSPGENPNEAKHPWVKWNGDRKLIRNPAHTQVQSWAPAYTGPSKEELIERKNYNARFWRHLQNIDILRKDMMGKAAA